MGTVGVPTYRVSALYMHRYTHHLHMLFKACLAGRLDIGFSKGVGLGAWGIIVHCTYLLYLISHCVLCMVEVMCPRCVHGTLSNTENLRAVTPEKMLLVAGRNFDSLRLSVFLKMTVTSTLPIRTSTSMVSCIVINYKP